MNRTEVGYRWEVLRRTLALTDRMTPIKATSNPGTFKFESENLSDDVKPPIHQLLTQQRTRGDAKFSDVTQDPPLNNVPYSQLHKFTRNTFTAEYYNESDKPTPWYQTPNVTQRQHRKTFLVP